MKVLILILILVAVAEQRDVGAKLALRKESTKKAANAFIPLIQTEINELVIDPIETEISGISLKVWDIKLKMDIPENSIEVDFQEPNVVVGGVNNLSGVVSMTVKAKKWFISKTLDCTAYLSSVNGAARVTIAREQAPDGENFLPKVEIGDIDVGFDIEIDIDGGFIGAIIDLFHSFIEKKVKSEVGKLVNDMIKPKINEVIKELVGDFLPLIELPNGLSMLTSIDQDPYLPVEDVFSCGAHVRFFVEDNFTPAREESKRLRGKSLVKPIFTISSPDYIPEGNDFQTFLGVETCNSGLAALHKKKLLEIVIDPSTIPSLPIKLNTSFLNYIFRGIEDKYGVKDVKIGLATIKEPTLKLTEGEITFDLDAKIDFIVVSGGEDGEDELAVSLESDFVIDAEGELTFGKGSAKVNTVNFSNITVVDSTVEVKTDLLDNLFSVILQIAIPALNDGILKEINIPAQKIEMVTVSELSVKLGKDYAHLGASADAALAIMTKYTDLFGKKRYYYQTKFTC